MKAERLEEIRADIWCEPWKDPQLFPDILVRVFNELGYVATATCRCYPGGVSPASYEGPQRDCPLHGETSYWAEQLLEVLDQRARFGIPFDEPYDDQPPTDPEDL